MILRGLDLTRLARLAIAASILATTAACGNAGTLADLDGLVVAPAVAGLATDLPTQPPVVAVRDSQEIQDVLNEAAAAFLENDTDRLRPLLHDPTSAFGQAWLERVANMAELPLASYEFEVDDSLPDLATTAARDRYAQQIQVVYVLERLALQDFDDKPANEDLFLTMVDTPAGWRIAGDRDAESLGLISVDHLWDHGPVSTRREGPILALFHPDGPAIGALVEDSLAAVELARQRWPETWPERSPVIVPRDEEELGELLHVTFDLSNFVAFATATPSGERSEYELTGSRIVINSSRFLGRETETRRSILVHELIHIATRPSGGTATPSWLDEGIAQALGEERSTTGTRLIDAISTGNRLLPTDGQFTVGGRDRIFLSYQSAWSFVDHLKRRFGTPLVGDFYAMVGRGSVGEPGTEDYHVNRAATAVFGESLQQLVDVWRQGT